MSNNYQYDKPLRVSYSVTAAVLTALGVVGAIQGPAGKVGRVVDLSYGLKVATDAVSELTLDTVAGLTAPLVVGVAAAAISTGGVATKAELLAATVLPADTAVLLSVTDDTATTGTADVNVTVEWY